MSRSAILPLFPGKDLVDLAQYELGSHGDSAWAAWADNKANVKDGNFKIVVLMDALEERLKNMITFINRNSKFSVYAVEVDFYKYEDYEVLIPRLFGANVVKDIEVTGTSGRRTWDETTFFEGLRDCQLTAGPLAALANVMLEQSSHFSGWATRLLQPRWRCSAESCSTPWRMSSRLP